VNSNRGSNGERALQMYARRVHTIERRRRSEYYRAAAIRRLRLTEGDVVVDVGCGTGLSFPLLHEAVGPNGLIVGIEQSPHMISRAQRRVSESGWQNVRIIEARAQDAEISPTGDAALFYLTHDIMSSSAAVERVLSQLKPGAAVAAFGGVWAQPKWARPENILAFLWARGYITSFEAFDCPWNNLANLVPDLKVRRVMSISYLASGHVPNGEG
jgi:predicted O-methyltransferase YrrM